MVTYNFGLKSKNNGSELINILKSFGGINNASLLGNCLKSDEFFYIDLKDNVIYSGNESMCSLLADHFKIFTVEEFKEKYPFDIGNFVYDSCGDQCEIIDKRWDCYSGEVSYNVKYLDETEWYFADKLNTHKIVNIDLSEYDHDKIEILLGDSYEISDIINSNKIILSKKAIRFPKTYSDCCKMIKHNPGSEDNVEGYESELLKDLQKLILCRNVYWKILGYDGPIWEMHSGKKYCIVYSGGEIKFKDFVTESRILSFPNHEVRSIFYNNFITLIEKCKELI